jgi:DNA-directed RNA polymerase specialized sigma24 family protein
VRQRWEFVQVRRQITYLPERFRTAFMLRMIEGMSVEETANLLGLQP